MSTLALFGGAPVRRKPFAPWPVFDDTERAAVLDVLESGAWGGYSPKVSSFEQAFADYHGARFGISACNGTVTLEAALLAAGVQPGDEVIVPPITFIATATAVLRVGAGFRRYRTGGLQPGFAEAFRRDHAGDACYYSGPFWRSSRRHGRDP
jgi:histidinol-phosphate/aromatic aminotransferase/cobyric acid decarboxylase-like protein